MLRGGFGGLALDLVAAPASQTYVERLFSVCGDLTPRKRNKTKGSLENSRVFLKLNCAMLAKLPRGAVGCSSSKSSVTD